MIPIFDSKRQYEKIGSEIEKAVLDVLRSGAYILGPNVKALEKEFHQHRTLHRGRTAQDRRYNQN